MVEALIRFCAPTLSAVKSAGAFGYSYSSEKELENQIHGLNRRLLNKGIVVLPLRALEKRALIYAFRPAVLSFELSHEIARGILSAYKYPQNNLFLDILCLAERLEGNRFPHELGLFLGYPPCDVLGFILNGGARYKKAGLWKVYADEEEAERRFALYKDITASLLCRYLNGESLEDITVFTQNIDSGKEPW